MGISSTVDEDTVGKRRKKGTRTILFDVVVMIFINNMISYSTRMLFVNPHPTSEAKSWYKFMSRAHKQIVTRIFESDGTVFRWIDNERLTYVRTNSRTLFFIFSVFLKTKITIFTTNQCEKCPYTLWCWDSNPRPSEHESPPITTRPGVPLIFELKTVSVIGTRTQSAVSGFMPSLLLWDVPFCMTV